VIPLSALRRRAEHDAAGAESYQLVSSVTVSFTWGNNTSMSDATREVVRCSSVLACRPQCVDFLQDGGRLSDLAGARARVCGDGALLAVYIVLGILYESLVHPLTIISTLPSASVGAMLALLLFKVDLNVISIIGIILLIGIVKKNAIMMIDFCIGGRTRNTASQHAMQFSKRAGCAFALF